MAAKKDDTSESKWICKICLGDLKQPVVTQCGHLFCWKCMFRWWQQEKSCPVCKGGIPTTKPPHLTPIYGHDGDTKTEDDNKDESKDNPEDIPDRPRGQRDPEPPRRRNNGGFEIQFFGPFQIFEFFFDILQANQGQYASYQDQMDDYISKGIIVFLVVTIFSIVIGLI